MIKIYKKGSDFLITLKEALNKNIFKTYKLLTHSDFSDKRIDLVGILDYENPSNISSIFKKNEMVITTLLSIKDSKENLYEIVDELIKCDACCLAIKDIYFNSIDLKTKELAENNNFPIILFGDTFFEDIIINVSKINTEKQNMETIKFKINDIISKNLDSYSIRKLALEINPHFLDSHFTIFFKFNTHDSNNFSNHKLINTSFTDFIFPYKDGYLLIISRDIKYLNSLYLNIKNELNDIGINTSNIIYGFSSIKYSLSDLSKSIKEACYAYNHCACYDKNNASFNKIGLDKLVAPLLQNDWLKEYYQALISPIEVYDLKNNSELLNTAIAYVKFYGNIKKTSQNINQHENTVRYRLNKISSILNLEMDKLYEELTIAIRIHILLDSKDMVL